MMRGNASARKADASPANRLGILLVTFGRETGIVGRGQSGAY